LSVHNEPRTMLCRYGYVGAIQRMHAFGELDQLAALS